LIEPMSDNPLERARRLANTPYQLERVASAIAGLHERLGLVEAAQRSLVAEIQAVTRLEALRLLGELRPPALTPAPPLVDAPVDLAEGLRRLEPRAPRAFSLWAPLLDVNADAYVADPMSSCSIDGHRVAEAFGVFVRAHARRAILDIGCGPQPVPVYLDGLPVDCLAGLDPLPPLTHHPFVFHRGVAEYLPWADDGFGTVIAATSLDHVLLLDAVLEEIVRVLDRDGRFLLWVGLMPGARPYDPYGPDVAQLDAFHLFHFDEPWLLELLRTRFRVVERLAPLAGNASVFYALAPRAG
jgi:SAM-dependent methyltransferase